MAPGCYDLFFCQQCAPKSNSLRPSHLPPEIMPNVRTLVLQRQFRGRETCMLGLRGWPTPP